jgi:hypothetical protein
LLPAFDPDFGSKGDPGQSPDLLARWIFDPLPVTPATHINSESAVDLVHRLPFGHVFHGGDQLFDFPPGVLFQILIAEAMRCGIGEASIFTTQKF